MLRHFLDAVRQASWRLWQDRRASSGWSDRKNRQFVPGVEGLEARDNPSFLAGIPSAAGLDPSAVAVGDFNKDGKMDVAVISSQNDTISILFGKGNGKFDAPVTLAAGNGPGGIAVADLNHDGKLDLVVTNSLD